MPDLVTCPHCAAAIPAGRFCARCGRPLPALATAAKPAVAPSPGAPPAGAPIAPAVTPMAPVGPAATVPLEVPPPHRRAARLSPRNLGAAVITMALLTAATYTVRGVPVKHTVTGDMSLHSAQAFGSYSPNQSCTGLGGYDDMSEGAQVVVENESGVTLATTTLGAGTFDGVDCVFPFQLENVRPAKFYRVQAGRESRGAVQYSYADMVRNHWAAHLSLGN